MVECLEVETEIFHICAVQEVNIYAKVSCEMQEVPRTLFEGGAGRTWLRIFWANSFHFLNNLLRVSMIFTQ